jgi:hypothetical protein
LCHRYAGWTDESVKVKSLDATNEIVTLERKPVIGFRKEGIIKAK